MNLLNESKLRQLATAALRTRGLANFSASAEMIKEARAFTSSKIYDVFLSHRTGDAEIVWGLKAAIEAEGLSCFVYWVENPAALTQPVTRETADGLRTKMRSCRSLVYADTYAATESKWMPWELGYVDGFRQRVAIFPVAKGSSTTASYVGQEYLGLYPWIRESSTSGRLAVVDRANFLNFLKEWVQEQ
jgi:hypothetical protein